MTIIWCMVPEIWSMTKRIFCHFGPFFSLFTPNNPENQSFEKMNKTPGDITILHMCTINDNHLMYGSWDMDREDRIFCDYGSFFALSPPYWPKNQNVEKIKKDIWRHHQFTLVYQKLWSYATLFLRYNKWQM